MTTQAPWREYMTETKKPLAKVSKTVLAALRGDEKAIKKLGWDKPDKVLAGRSER